MSKSQPLRSWAGMLTKHCARRHGNNFEYGGVTTYAISVNDGEGKTLFMDATGAGLWQVLCHVNCKCIPSLFPTILHLQQQKGLEKKKPRLICFLLVITSPSYPRNGSQLPGLLP